eukprot:6153715-Pyramimonas_sp.AAC.1
MRIQSRRANDAGACIGIDKPIRDPNRCVRFPKTFCHPRERPKTRNQTPWASTLWAGAIWAETLLAETR